MPYTEPTAADLKARYPAFTGVDDATVTYWLTDAHRAVDTSWIEGDYPVALIEVAAHNMVRVAAPGIAGSDVSGFIAAGVTMFRSGGRSGFQAQFSDDAIKSWIDGGYESTDYGLRYLGLLKKNKGGGSVTSPGAVCYPSPFNGCAGPMPGFGFGGYGWPGC